MCVFLLCLAAWLMVQMSDGCRKEGRSEEQEDEKMWRRERSEGAMEGKGGTKTPDGWSAEEVRWGERKIDGWRENEGITSAVTERKRGSEKLGERRRNDRRRR